MSIYEIGFQWYHLEFNPSVNVIESSLMQHKDPADLTIDTMIW